MLGCNQFAEVQSTIAPTTVKPMDIERLCHLLCESGSDYLDTWTGKETRCKPLLKQLEQAGRKSLELARKWFRKAADSGHVQAMNYLGFMLYNGLGGAKDTRQAQRWLQKCAAAGDVLCMARLGIMFRSGKGGIKDMALARKCFQKVADAGNVIGMCNLGFMLRLGEGGPRDMVQARELFEKAAKMGEMKCSLNLGIMLRTGNGGPRDSAQARVWFRKAAEAGITSAMRELAQMLERTEGGPIDEEESRRWFQKAADNGSKIAAETLIAKLEAGEGGPRDLVGALSLAEQIRNEPAINRLRPLVARILSSRRERLVLLCLSRRRLLQHVMERPHTTVTAVATSPSDMPMTTFVSRLVLYIGYNNALWRRVCAFCIPLKSLDQPHHPDAFDLMCKGFDEKSVYRTLRLHSWDFHLTHKVLRSQLKFVQRNSTNARDGVVKSWNHNRGFGFIEYKQKISNRLYKKNIGYRTKRIFCHSADIRDGAALRVGDTVRLVS